MIRELGAPWLVEMYKYMCNNPQIIVNDFVKCTMDDVASIVSEDSSE